VTKRKQNTEYTNTMTSREEVGFYTCNYPRKTKKHLKKKKNTPRAHKYEKKDVSLWHE